MPASASRPKRYAGGGPLKRRVRQHAADEGAAEAVRRSIPERGLGVARRSGGGAELVEVPRTWWGAAPRSGKGSERCPKRAKHNWKSKSCLRGPLGLAAAMVDHSGARVCLTFELSGHHRHGAWAARRSINQGVARPKRYAGGGPLERRVGHTLGRHILVKYLAHADAWFNRVAD